MNENVSIGLAGIAIFLSIIALASGFVLPTSNIGVNTITESELADDSVTGDQLFDGAITDLEISDLGISKISIDSISGNEIIDNTIFLEDLNIEVLNAVMGFEIANNSILSEKIADNAITTDKIANDTVSTDKIADGAITSDKLANDTVSTDKIADGAVTSDKLANDSITWENINDKPLEIVAAGHIKNDGEILQNYNIESVSIESNAVQDYYVISINGIDYDWDEYITIITTFSASNNAYSSSSLDEDLRIYLWNVVSNTPTTGDFYFITYKIN